MSIAQRPHARNKIDGQGANANPPALARNHPNGYDNGSRQFLKEYGKGRPGSCHIDEGLNEKPAFSAFAEAGFLELLLNG